MQTPEASNKPTKGERNASRNELDKYAAMNWDDANDSTAELQDPKLWISDASSPTQLQEDIAMLLAAKQVISGASEAAQKQ